MDNLENLIEPELKEVINNVINELGSKEELTAFSPISKEKAIELLNKEGFMIYSEFEDQLLTPYAVAKYVSLLQEEKEILSKVENDISSWGLDDSIEWTLSTHFKNEVNMIKIVPEEVPNGIIVKYRLDHETDRIYYTINSGTWGWNVSKAQLINLLTGKEASVIQTKPQSAKSDMSFEFNGMRIDVTKI